MKLIEQVQFRKDKYTTSLYVKKGHKVIDLNLKNGEAQYENVNFFLKRHCDNNLIKYAITIQANADLNVDSVGFRLGIDCYMDKYPDWDNKFFPTALRCEKKGFWGCFCSPMGKILGIASPSSIVSWNNIYNATPYGDVGHRIFTSCLDFANVNKQPDRHFKKEYIKKGDKLCYEIYLSMVSNKTELYKFVESYANISIPTIDDYLLDKRNTDLPYGRNIISKDDEAETSVYVRHNWFYYMESAAMFLKKCQQKPGSHVEGWYGFYTMAAYAKIINDEKYTNSLVNQFDKFFKIMTKGKTHRLKAKAAPHRLQNVSGLLSLLANMYDLTEDKKYLHYAEGLADWLISLQSSDGSYRSHGTHYTCVIYPAKSMLDLSLTMKNAGWNELSKKLYDSAYLAVKNLQKLLDNIQTEGQMTFEDGMISCEALQLAEMALYCNGQERTDLTNAAEYILNKHRCLEQQFIPDCRTIGATLRFWEARYDINFNSNMLNTPHGWTSWKTYATYYLYLLTGKLEYLRDTMNTIGACMQVIDEKGVLRWAFVLDPCVVGKEMIPTKDMKNIQFVDRVVGEEYLTMVSDWYKQNPNKLCFQYIKQFKSKLSIKRNYGGSCDNDVNEHFKCLYETVFGKAFIHIERENEYLYNCYKKDSEYLTDDKFVKKYVVYSSEICTLKISGKLHNINCGITIIDL